MHERIQYLDDFQVRTAFHQFKRILKNNGVLILHVKNSSSLYLSTLWAAKRIKSLLGKKPRIEYYRSFQWYIRELRTADFDIVDYNSFNLLMLESMPKALLLFFQKIELRNYDRPFFRTAFIRRHGSDLKIKAKINKGC